MKKCWLIAVACVLSWVVGPLAVSAEQLVVFVNLDRAFNEFYKTKLADTQLKEQADGFNDERKALVVDYEKVQKEFEGIRDQAQNVALSDEVRTEKRDLAEEKLIELRDYESRIRRFDDSRRKQLDDQSRRMKKRIVEEIQQVVKDHAQTQGYSTVIDSSGQSLNSVELILYTDPKVDITDAIIGILNKGKVQDTVQDKPQDKASGQSK